MSGFVTLPSATSATGEALLSGERPSRPLSAPVRLDQLPANQRAVIDALLRAARASQARAAAQAVQSAQAAGGGA
jgi:hypothetical protein